MQLSSSARLQISIALQVIVFSTVCMSFAESAIAQQNAETTKTYRPLTESGVNCIFYGVSNMGGRLGAKGEDDVLSGTFSSIYCQLPGSFWRRLKLKEGKITESFVRTEDFGELWVRHLGGFVVFYAEPTQIVKLRSWLRPYIGLGSCMAKNVYDDSLLMLNFATGRGAFTKIIGGSSPTVMARDFFDFVSTSAKLHGSLIFEDTRCQGSSDFSLAWSACTNGKSNTDEERASAVQCIVQKGFTQLSPDDFRKSSDANEIGLLRMPR